MVWLLAKPRTLKPRRATSARQPGSVVSQVLPEWAEVYRVPSVMVGSRFASRTSEAARDEDVSHRGESDGSLHVRFLTNWSRNLSVVGRAVKGVRNGVCIPVSAAQFFFAKWLSRWFALCL